MTHRRLCIFTLGVIVAGLAVEMMPGGSLHATVSLGGPGFTQFFGSITGPAR